jgi:type II pantothenate kinase
MIIGIDVGGTNTQGVLLDEGRVAAKASIPGNGKREAASCYRLLRERAGHAAPRVALTGGGARRVSASSFPAPFRLIDEIRAIGAGGMRLSGKKDVFVVSIGTGTAFVSVKAGRPVHAGGTGIGGGTIHGLTGLMLGMPLEKVESIAKASKEDLDLTVGDIVGRGIGKLPASATASNFGRAGKKAGKPAIARSLLKMIGESIGATCYFSAKSAGQEDRVLVCGRVALNAVVKDTITRTIRTFGGRSSIPEDAEYCAALGAADILGGRK